MKINCKERIHKFLKRARKLNNIKKLVAIENNRMNI